MRRLFMLLVVVVLLLVVLDFVAKAWVESRVESAAAKRLPDAVAVDASVDSFPILARLAVSGKVKRFTFDMAGIDSEPLDVSLLHLELHDIRFDRSSLFSDPEVTDVGFVELAAVISEASVRDFTGADIRFFEDGATITVAGNTLTARAEMGDDGIELEVGAATVTVPLPDLNVVPCDATFEFEKAAIVLRCTTTNVPRVFVEALGSVAMEEITG